MLSVTLEGRPMLTGGMKAADNRAIGVDDTGTEADVASYCEVSCLVDETFEALFWEVGA